MKSLGIRCVGRIAILVLSMGVLAACSTSGRVGLAGMNAGFSVAGPMVNEDGSLAYLTNTVIEATGYAVIQSQVGDPAQQRLMAIKASKLDAYRALAEEVYGQYVNATGTMTDMSITEDHLKSRVEGVIYGARVVSITPIGGETYETKLALSQRTIDELVTNYLQGSSAGR